MIFFNTVSKADAKYTAISQADQGLLSLVAHILQFCETKPGKNTLPAVFPRQKNWNSDEQSGSTCQG